MVALDTPGLLQAVYDLVNGLPDLTDNVVLGVPESFPTTISAYVALGDFELADKASGGLMVVEQECLIVIGYRVREAESTAEQQIAVLKDALQNAWLTDRTLGGACDTSRWMSGLATTPQYQAIAGAEVRLYPLLLRLTQRYTLGG